MTQAPSNLDRTVFLAIAVCGAMIMTCGCSRSKVLERHIANEQRNEPAPPRPTIAYLNETGQSLAPGSDDVYRLLEARQYKKAHELTTQMIESDLASQEEKAEYYLFRGVTNRLMVNEKAGYEDLNKSIELNPGDWRAYNARREAFENRSMHDRAAEDGEKARELNPKLGESDPQVPEYRVNGGVI